MIRRTALQFGLACGIATAWPRLAGAAALAREETSAVQAADAPGAGEGVSAVDNVCGIRSGHAAPAPVGVGADFAAMFPGGRGEGQHFVDVEDGWTLEHDSLVAHRIGPPLVGSIDDRSRPHGTAALGIVCGSSITGGYIGLAPEVASVHVSSRVNDVQAAIRAAIDKLSEIGERDPGHGGGVLLLETQAHVAGPRGAMCHLPIETLPEIFELVRGASRRGITVIEAAGNGCDAIVPETGANLDDYVDEHGVHVLRRDSPRGDSGAILVAAARSGVTQGQHRRFASSNYGSRIDCYAWGEAVRAPSSTSRPPFSTTSCTSDFGETSAAAAIIAGVALIVQGVMAQAESGRRLSPQRLREILSDPALGTSGTGADGRIGVMPDLARILAPAVLGVTLRRSSRYRADARE